MSRLRNFGATVTYFLGPVAHITIDRDSSVKIGGRSMRCLTPELRTIGEIDCYERLLIADLEAACAEAKARFGRQGKNKRGQGKKKPGQVKRKRRKL
jgi:hypothetical protein